MIGGLRAHQPKQGLIGLLGGFVNRGENALSACARETEEETGLVLPPSRFAFAGGFISPSNQLLLFHVFQGELPHVLFKTLLVNSEVSSFHLRAPGDELAFPSHTDFARRFFL